MHGKYKVLFILFLLLSVSFIFSEENKKYITFLSNIDNNLTNRTINVVNYMIDIAELNLFNKYKDNLTIKNINGEVDSSEVKNVSNYIFAQGIDSYYYLNITEEDGNIKIEIKLYDSLNNILFEDLFVVFKEDFKENDRYILKEKEEKWIAIINESSIKIFEIKGKVVKKRGEFSKLSFQHDFPFINIGITAVSGKFYFDERINKTNKLFSFFPFEIRATVFPVRFFETGLFFTINFDNLIFKYFDYDKDQYDFFDMGLILYYGFFAGLSIFNDFAYYSVGLQVYNLFYDISYYSKWKKTDDYRSYFLPQFALYQKVDFKLFKFLYYSVFFNFRTMPKFYVKDNTFYSNPFSYDFFIIEISFVGFSFIF